MGILPRLRDTYVIADRCDLNSTLGTPCSDAGFWQFLLQLLRTGTPLATGHNATSGGQQQHTLTHQSNPRRANAWLASISSPLLPLYSGLLRAVDES